MKRIVFLLTLLMLLVFVAGSFYARQYYPRMIVKEMIVTLPAPPPETRVEIRVEKEIVERIVRVNRELRDFATYVEFKEVMRKYHEGILLVGGTCIEQSRLIVEVGREDGYYLDTEMVRGDKHMVVKGFLLDAGNGRSGIGLFDQETGLTWLKYQTQITSDSGDGDSSVTVPSDDGKKPKKPKK